MFEYKVLFKDEIFNEVCAAKGRVTANTRAEATAKIYEFYPEIISLKVIPFVIENEFDYGGEYDL